MIIRKAATDPIPPWICLLAGAASAVVGLVPWLITGLRLPLQNLWAIEVLPAQMPRALLPFSNYYLILVAGLLVVGGGIAGLFAQNVRASTTRARVLAVIAGLLAVQSLAIAQTATTVQAGLQESRAAALYLAVLIVAAVLSTLTAVLVVVLASSRSRAAAMIGFAIAAVFAGQWLGGLILPPGSLPRPGLELALQVLPWVPSVLVGLALAWGGLNTVGRVAAAVVALLGLWIAPAPMTAISSAAGSRVLARQPGELADYALAVFQAALTAPGLVFRSLAAAVVVAALGLLVRRVRGTRRSVGADQPGIADPG